MYGIFTKPIHVEKLVSYLNTTKIDYLISTKKDEVYSSDFNIGVSYCFPWIVDTTKGEVRWFNYHPAPLPEYPGPTNYTDAMRDKIRSFSVTLHQMTQEVDRGEIIKQLYFPLRSIPTHASELGVICHYYLFQLFKETIESL